MSTQVTNKHLVEIVKVLEEDVRKGEMLVECKNQEFMTAYLDNTMSCSHPDIGRMYSEKESRHCGYCLPCVIRQAAILHAGIKDKGSYREAIRRYFADEKDFKDVDKLSKTHILKANNNASYNLHRAWEIINYEK